MTTKLSLCMIVKNEERWLDGCLKSVAGLVDEIVIVDTGSTDRTIEIARAHGANVFPETWTDDFSRARNLSIEKATGDWILVLDADEVIERRDHGKIRSLIETSQASSYFLIQTTYADEGSTLGWIPNHLGVPESSGYPGFMESPLVRLFRNIPEIRFHGVMHEHAWHEGAAQGALMTEIRIHHYGKYVGPEANQKKNELYLKLGYEKCRHHPDDSKAWYELGTQLWWMKKIDASREAFQKAHELDPEAVPPMVGLAGVENALRNYREATDYYLRILERDPNNLLPYQYLPGLLVETRNFELAEEMLRLGEPRVGHLPPYHVNKGVLQQAVGNYRGAITSFNRALSLNPRESLAHLNKGISLMHLGLWDEARTCLEESMTSPFTRVEALRRLGEWHFEKQDLTQARNCFERALQEDGARDATRYQLVVTLIRQKELQRARDVLAGIQRYDVFETSVLEKLRQCCLAVGDRKRAEEIAGWQSHPHGHPGNDKGGSHAIREENRIQMG